MHVLEAALVHALAEHLRNADRPTSRRQQETNAGGSEAWPEPAPGKGPLRRLAGGMPACPGWVDRVLSFTA